MKKRIISTVLSAVTAISAVSATSSNALWYWGKIDEDIIEETFKDYEKLDVAEYSFLRCTDCDYMYMKTYGFQTCIYELRQLNDGIFIEVNTNVDISELEKEIKALDENIKISIEQIENYDTIHITVYSEVITSETAKKICEIVGDKALSIEYKFGTCFYDEIIYDYTTGYPVNRVVDIIEKDGYREVIHESNEEILTEYAEKHSDEVEFEYFYPSKEDHRGFEPWTGTYYLIPKKELTIMEHLELVKNIYEETGLVPLSYSRESASAPISSTLDLTNYLNGDANCDSVATMADAAAILQAIGNPDKYSLSDLGAFNADFANDGLTPDDAIAIQKRLAGITE